MIMQGVQRVRDKFNMEFNEAVAYTANKNKNLIYNTVERICGVDLGEESSEDGGIIDNEVDSTNDESGEGDSDDEGCK